MNEKLKVLDLFSGIGGFSLGLEATGGFETVAFCEIEPYPCKVLAKHWPDVPIFNDVRTIDATGLGTIDCITGGYPCQPFSLAGKRGGTEDDRHLWPEMHRIVASIRPRWVIAENVAGHINMGLDEVLSDLEGEGYTCWPLVIPACAVDASHRRDRCWVLAHTKGKPKRSRLRKDEQARQRGRRSGNSGGKGENVSNSDSNGIQGRSVKSGDGKNRPKPGDKQPTGLRDDNRGRGGGKAEWLPEPPVGRVAHGIPKRVDRLKCLGNSIVPQIVTQIGYAILEAEEVNA